MNKILTTAVSAAFLSVCTISAAELTLNPPEGVHRTFNAGTSGAYGASRVETKLNVNIKEDTKKVHFIRDNSDPYVVTKGYLIKNADAYVLRGVLKTIVSGSLVDSPVQVDSVKYSDGRGVLLVSAEEYRFQNVGNGMTMDQLVASLDRKDLPNSSGTVDMAYFPRYNTAKSLLKMMEESGIGFTQGQETAKVRLLQGMNLSSDPGKLSYAVSDNQLNAIIMTAAGFDVKEALRFLKTVDTPAKEIQLSYKLIEVYAENDQKLGLDFQAWKNNDGIDLFSAGGRYATNWTNGLTPNNGYTFSEFYNFNPKWNTKYLDFLTVCGKAKVVSTGTMNVANGGKANLTLSDGLFSVVTKDIKQNEKTTTDTSHVKKSDTTLKDEEGTTIGTSSTTVDEYKTTKEFIPWTLEALLPGTDGKSVFADQIAGIPTGLLDNHQVRQGKTQEVETADGNLFQFSVNGNVHAKASNLNIALASTSIIGWDGQGKARMTRSSYQTSIQISSEKKEFVIGGITKSSVVRSVAGLPLLKDIPFLGWLFSTETDTVKKSQFVLVATAELVEPGAGLSKEVKSKIDAVDSKVKKSVKSPSLSTVGFQQWLLDK